MVISDVKKGTGKINRAILQQYFYVPQVHDIGRKK